MLYWSEFVGAVVYKNGKKIGHMENMMFDPKKKMITGLVLERRNWDLYYRYFPFSRIQEINRENILIKESSKMKLLKGNEKETMLLVGDIINDTILDEKGGWVGRFVDFSFDPENGMIREMLVSESFLEDLWQGRKRMPVLSHVEFSREWIHIDQDTHEEIQGVNKGIKRWMDSHVL